MSDREDEMAGWVIFSDIIGWVYFVAWSVSFYPQVYTNWRRKSVTGLSFDYELYNILGFSCLALYNSFFFWSPLIREEYYNRNGNYPQVTVNDVFFGIHAVVLTCVHLFQIAIFDRGNQRISRFALLLVSGAATAAVIWTIIAATGHSHWIDVLYYLSYIKLGLTFIKYLPQVYLNWRRKSTVGWNIVNILLDLTGGTLSIVQLLIDCWVADDWSGITGNFVKFGLGFVSIFFDLVFITQHFCLYPERSEPVHEDEETKRLVSYPENDIQSAESRHPLVSAFVWLTTQEKN